MSPINTNQNISQLLSLAKKLMLWDSFVKKYRLRYAHEPLETVRPMVFDKKHASEPCFWKDQLPPLVTCAVSLWMKILNQRSMALFCIVTALFLTSHTPYWSTELLCSILIAEYSWKKHIKFLIIIIWIFPQISLLSECVHSKLLFCMVELDSLGAWNWLDGHEWH